MLPPVAVRLGATAQVLLEPFAARLATSVRVYAFVDRPTWLGPFVQVRPGLTVGLRWQSLAPSDLAGPGPRGLEPHPEIYQPYLHDHPVLVRPELELRAFPLQDVVVWLEGRLIPNSPPHASLASLDHVDVELGAAGVARRPRVWVPSWGLSYQASPRFADADRPQAFVRHRVRVELGLGVWAGDTARIGVGVANQVFVSTIAPLRDVVELWIRVDASLGRRMRDVGPGRQWFSELWAPRAWGDEPEQASSTIAPIRARRR